MTAPGLTAEQKATLEKFHERELDFPVTDRAIRAALALIAAQAAALEIGRAHV